MNYLAHFHLAGDEPGHMVGALLGDFVKGPMAGIELPDPVKQGILLHRRIDSFTDQHSNILSLGRTLPADIHRYKSILTDLFFDYALAKHWHRFSDESLECYEQRVHTILNQHQHLCNHNAQQMIQRLQRYQLLVRYSHRTVLDGIIDSIGQRLGQPQALNTGASAMWKMREEWETAFLEIYPELQSFAATELDRLKPAN